MNINLEYLEHSIQTTSCDNIRSSLIVQRAHCLNQIDHLKRRLQSRLTNKLTNRKENLQTVRSNPDSSSSSSSLDHHHHHHNRQLLSKNTRDDLVMANRITSESDDIDLYNILKRQESLLEQLSFTLKSQSDQKSSPSSSLGSGRNSNSKIDGQTSPILIVNELQTMNEKMKFAFRNLMETMEKSKQETKALQKENHSLKKELNNLKNDEGKSTNAGNNRTSTISLFPELPPLETPKLLY